MRPEPVEGQPFAVSDDASLIETRDSPAHAGCIGEPVEGQRASVPRRPDPDAGPNRGVGGVWSA